MGYGKEMGEGKKMKEWEWGLKGRAFVKEIREKDLKKKKKRNPGKGVEKKGKGKG